MPPLAIAGGGIVLFSPHPFGLDRASGGQRLLERGEWWSLAEAGLTILTVRGVTHEESVFGRKKFKTLLLYRLCKHFHAFMRSRRGRYDLDGLSDVKRTNSPRYPPTTQSKCNLATTDFFSRLS